MSIFLASPATAILPILLSIASCTATTALSDFAGLLLISEEPWQVQASVSSRRLNVNRSILEQVELAFSHMPIVQELQRVVPPSLSCWKPRGRKAGGNVDKASKKILREADRINAKKREKCCKFKSVSACARIPEDILVAVTKTLGPEVTTITGDHCDCHSFSFQDSERSMDTKFLVMSSRPGKESKHQRTEDI